jgi:rubrerythrin
VKTHYLWLELTDEEIIKLDGSSNKEVQEEVDKAKKRVSLSKKFTKQSLDITSNETKFISDCIAYARKKKILGFTYRQIFRCDVCGKKAGYHKYTRTSRHHIKGDNNYDRQKTFTGIELAVEFVFIKNSVTLGCCSKCWKKIQPILIKELKAYKIKADISEKITGQKSRYKRYKNRRCSKCKWKGHEGEMGKKSTVLGDGSYPATCPKCEAGGNFFSNDIETIDGWSLVKC